MSTDTERTVSKSNPDPASRSAGQVLAFVSAKGGTGKTILAATASYLLLKAGRRVVTIDADFSTRGLSLYLLGSILQSRELTMRVENCLADALFEKTPISEISPREVRREGLSYQLIVSNRDLWRAGVPDERFLGAPSVGTPESIPLASEYYKFLKELCDRLRQEFDYVIVDTRGGYDFTSAAPAVVADGYVIVLEADAISMDQIRGFKKKIEEYADTLGAPSALKGFIINKAISSVDDKVFPEALLRLYEAKTFGTIPADRDAIRAYQSKEIPTEKAPDSDFACYSLEAIENLISPSLNWNKQGAAAFEKLGSHIRTMWAARNRADQALRYAPFVNFSVVAIAILFYYLYRYQIFGRALMMFYIALSALVLSSVAGSLIKIFTLLRKSRTTMFWRATLAGGMCLLWIGLAYLTCFRMPNTFSRDELLRRIETQNTLISFQSALINEYEKSKLDMQAQIQFLTTDQQRFSSSDASAQARIQQLQGSVGELQAKLSALTAQSQNHQEGARPTLSDVIPGACGILVLDNPDDKSVELKGWRLTSRPSGAVVYLNDAKPILPKSSLTLLFGAECSPASKEMEGVGLSVHLIDGVTPQFIFPGDGQVSLLDPNGQTIDVRSYGNYRARGITSAPESKKPPPRKR